MQAGGGVAQGELGWTGSFCCLPRPEPCLRSCCPHHPPALPPTAPLPQYTRSATLHKLAMHSACCAICHSLPFKQAYCR